MYISGVLSLSLIGCAFLSRCVSGTELTEESVQKELRSRQCLGQIVTGHQQSIHCNNAEYFRKVNSLYSGSKDDLRRCRRDLRRMNHSIGEEWAIRMLDAAGKPPGGILEANFVWPGDYFECLNASAPATGNHTSFNGRYCLFNHDLEVGNLTLPLSIGVCVPDTCDEDLLANITHITKKLVHSPIGSKRITGILCRPRTIPWDAPAIVMLTIIAIFLTLATTGTLVTIYKRKFKVKCKLGGIKSQPDLAVDCRKTCHNDGKKNGVGNGGLTVLDIGKNTDVRRNVGRDKLVQFLKCFCVLTNGANLLDTSKAEIRCLHGIRFLSMTWIILGHIFVFVQASGVSLGMLEATYRANTLAFEAITHGVFAVDSFFLLSGFLLTYLFLREADKKDGQISWGLYYFHRYWRLTPVYAAVLGSYYALTKYVGDGPFWHWNSYEAICSETWWWNMLYINNFADEPCLIWSWFLASDMQFYVISPLLLYPLWRNPKIGLFLVSSLMLVSWICATTISWHYEFLTTSTFVHTSDILLYLARMDEYFQNFYTKPYIRIGPYLIGILLGYVFYKEKDRERHLSTKVQSIGWCVAAVVSLTMIYGLHHVDTGVVLAAFYNALSPSLFTAALAWVVFTCATENGGFVNSILSNGLFVPLSRLTYCAYLVHPIIIVGYYQSLEKSIQFTFTVWTTLFLGFLVMSYMVALVAHLLFEAPFMAIEKMFIKRK